jgi:hypothetical protein
MVQKIISISPKPTTDVIAGKRGIPEKLFLYRASSFVE